MPMGHAGDTGEGGGRSQHLRARLGIGAVEHRKADIITDRQPDGAFHARRDHACVAGRDGGGFAIAVAAAEVDVEEMDLVIPRRDCALRREHIEVADFYHKCSYVERMLVPPSQRYFLYTLL